MVNLRSCVLAFWMVCLIQPAAASESERIELDTATIKGNTATIRSNKESPGAAYTAPWEHVEHENRNEYKLKLNDLFGDLFEPVLPNNQMSEK